MDPPPPVPTTVTRFFSDPPTAAGFRGSSAPSGPVPGPELLAAAVLRELFGDVARSPSAEPGVSTGPEPGAWAGAARPSIHEVLRPRLGAAERGDPRALAPGVDVDRALGRLVELVTGNLAGDGDGPILADRLLSRVEEVVEARLEQAPDLVERAAELRRAAGLAETALELHHARLLTGSDGSDGPGGSGGSGSPATAFGSDGGTDDPAGPIGSQGAAGPIDPVGSALGSFPYVANYRRLTSAELLGLERFVRPRHLTFCGAGALPLTGVLIHRWIGAAVRLVEIDPCTADLARRLVARLEGRGVITPGALEVETADAGAIDLGDTDAVVVASLVPRSARDRLVDRLAALRRCRRPALIVRSARGLVARFAYEAVDPATVGPGAYRHVGTVAPDGREPTSGPPLVATAHRSVLNTSEIYLP